MFKHILLPTDGSEASLRAVAKGAELAKSVGAEVTLMIAMDHFAVHRLVSGYGPEDESMQQAARDSAGHWLAAAQAVVDQHGVKSQQLIVPQGKVHQCILEAAKKSGADLIVMGTHGAGAFERLMVGSETQRVLAHTTIPVLVTH